MVVYAAEQTEWELSAAIEEQDGFLIMKPMHGHSGAAETWNVELDLLLEAWECSSDRRFNFELYALRALPSLPSIFESRFCAADVGDALHVLVEEAMELDASTTAC